MAFMFKFWNAAHRLARESPHQRIRNKRAARVPGYIGDATDRGQPGRFDKWAKLPDAAHRLYWRTRRPTPRSPIMSEVALPPMPEPHQKPIYPPTVAAGACAVGYVPTIQHQFTDFSFGPMFTADQMRDYARRAVLQERERIANEWDGCMYDVHAVGEVDIGAAIRGPQSTPAQEQAENWGESVISNPAYQQEQCEKNEAARRLLDEAANPPQPLGPGR